MAGITVTEHPGDSSCLAPLPLASSLLVLAPALTELPLGMRAAQP